MLPFPAFFFFGFLVFFFLYWMATRMVTGGGAPRYYSEKEKKKISKFLSRWRDRIWAGTTADRWLRQFFAAFLRDGTGREEVRATGHVLPAGLAKLRFIRPESRSKGEPRSATNEETFLCPQTDSSFRPTRGFIGVLGRRASSDTVHFAVFILRIEKVHDEVLCILLSSLRRKVASGETEIRENYRDQNWIKGLHSSRTKVRVFLRIF